MTTEQEEREPMREGADRPGLDADVEDVESGEKSDSDAGSRSEEVERAAEREADAAEG